MSQIMLHCSGKVIPMNRGERFMGSPSKLQIEELLSRLEDLRGHL
jgi:hypothetical protein